MDVRKQFPLGAHVVVVNVPYNKKWEGARGVVIGYFHSMLVIRATPFRPDLYSKPVWKLNPQQLKVTDGGFLTWARRFK